MMSRRSEVLTVLVVAVLAGSAWTYFFSRSMVSVKPMREDVTESVTVAQEQEQEQESSLAPTVDQQADERVEQLKTSTDVIRAASDQAISRLKAIRGCETNPGPNCPLNHVMAVTEPDGYQALLVDQTVRELAFLKAIAVEELKQGRNPSFSVGDVAGAFVRHRDDNVREQALSLASLLAISEPAKAVDIAALAIANTVSGPLTVQAIEILETAQAANPQLVDKAMVDKTLIRALTRGGWDVRDAVAEKILPFLNSENRETYSRILAKAPVRSKLALHLRLGLEEFDRMERL